MFIKKICFKQTIRRKEPGIKWLIRVWKKSCPLEKLYIQSQLFAKILYKMSRQAQYKQKETAISGKIVSVEFQRCEIHQTTLLTKFPQLARQWKLNKRNSLEFGDLVNEGDTRLQKFRRIPGSIFWLAGGRTRCPRRCLHIRTHTHTLLHTIHSFVFGFFVLTENRSLNLSR